MEDVQPLQAGEPAEEAPEPGETIALIEGVRVLEPVRVGPPALVQAAAAAATGFVAGAATAVVLSRRRAGRPLLAAREERRLLEPRATGTQTFLVRVQTLRRG